MKNIRRIDLRCDGNKRIASGHIRRCMTLAEEFLRAGAAVRLIVADDESAALTEGTDIPVVVLNSYYMAPDKELTELLRALKENKTDFLMIDSYAATREYLQTLRDAVTTGYIDDMHTFPYPTDVLLQYTSQGQAAERVRGLARRCLTGAAYAPLRPEFRGANARMPLRESVKRILVTTGGGDKNHMAYRIAQGFIDAGAGAFDGVELTVAAGSLSGDIGVLKVLAESDKRIKVAVDVRDMASLMASSDLAISAGGTTVYELCAVGVPSAVFVLGDDQARVVSSLEGTVAEVGVATDAIGAEASAQAALKWAARLCDKKNTELRADLSEKMRSVTDGRGAERVVSAVLEFLSLEQGV